MVSYSSMPSDPNTDFFGYQFDDTDMKTLQTKSTVKGGYQEPNHDCRGQYSPQNGLAAEMENKSKAGISDLSSTSMWSNRSNTPLFERLKLDQGKLVSNQELSYMGNNKYHNQIEMQVSGAKQSPIDISNRDNQNEEQTDSAAAIDYINGDCKSLLSTEAAISMKNFDSLGDASKRLSQVYPMKQKIDQSNTMCENKQDSYFYGPNGLVDYTVVTVSPVDSLDSQRSDSPCKLYKENNGALNSTILNSGVGVYSNLASESVAPIHAFQTTEVLSLNDQIQRDFPRPKSNFSSFPSENCCMTYKKFDTFPRTHDISCRMRDVSLAEQSKNNQRWSEYERKQYLNGKQNFTNSSAGRLGYSNRVPESRVLNRLMQKTPNSLPAYQNIYSTPYDPNLFETPTSINSVKPYWMSQNPGYSGISSNCTVPAPGFALIPPNNVHDLRRQSEDIRGTGGTEMAYNGLCGAFIPTNRYELSHPIPISKNWNSSIYEKPRFGAEFDEKDRGHSAGHTYSSTALLEEFRVAGKSEKWELSEICGHLYTFATNQLGSRFIQQKLETGDEITKSEAFDEIFPNALSLMNNVFGNYVIQKFLDFGTKGQKHRLVELMQRHMIDLAFQVYGCRVIQKALEAVDVIDKLNLIHELKGFVMDCATDQNGNHVLQKCIEAASRHVSHHCPAMHGRVDPMHIQFIIDGIVGHAVELSTHTYGCRVIQRLLEHCDPPMLCCIVDEIICSCHDLVKNQFGNYVIQHVIIHGSVEHRSIIMKTIFPEISKWSQHKYASNVVEVCLDHATKSELSDIVDVILQCDESQNSCPLLPMMKHQYGNYVVQKLLSNAETVDRDRIVRIIKHNAEFLKRFPFGKHVLSRLEGEGGEVCH